eukprot:TRINITY_DN3325_c4_g1_i1.p1 TRINITY_DN3325_c4_g1~~TRINITY_DN3325_c4_g1_i1.p1  ORF type:complete len:620 (+),score=163.58 TRINITY_DN3325_c4_g1_i1:195-1862(+)
MDGKLTLFDVRGLSSALSLNHSLKILILKNSSLTDKHITLLAKGIADNSNLTVLNLSNNPFSNASFMKLIDSLMSHPELNVLDVSKTNIHGHEAGQSLATILQKKFCQITELNLGNCNLRDSGINALCDGIQLNDSLDSIDISNNDFGSSVADVLGEAISLHPKLQVVNLANNRLFAGENAMFLFANHFSHTQSQITTWNLTNTCISDDIFMNFFDCIYLSNYKVVHTLLLGENRIGDVSACKIYTAFHHLCANHCTMQDTLETIASSWNSPDNLLLHTLDLSNTDITKEGSRVLGMLLRVNAEIHNLLLENNKLDDVVLDNFSHYLLYNTNLEQISFSGCMFDSTSIKNFLMHLPSISNLVDVNFSNCNLVDLSFVAENFKCRKIQKINFSKNIFNPSNIAMFFENIYKFDSLFVLDLSYCNIKDSDLIDMAVVSKNNEFFLQELNLDGNLISSSIDLIESLKEFLTIQKSLIKLSLNSNFNINNVENIEKLLDCMENSSIEILELNHSGIDFVQLEKKQSPVIKRITEKINNLNEIREVNGVEPFELVTEIPL